MAFLMLAAGQVVGAVVFGLLLGMAGAAVALAFFPDTPWALLAVTPDGKS
jgi:site-specific recombinase